jgi:hypothetical protein
MAEMCVHITSQFTDLFVILPRWLTGELEDDGCSGSGSHRHVVGACAVLESCGGFGRFAAIQGVDQILVVGKQPSTMSFRVPRKKCHAGF